MFIGIEGDSPISPVLKVMVIFFVSEVVLTKLNPVHH